MIAKKILHRLCSCGVKAVPLPNGRLELKAARGVLTTEMISFVRKHKAAVLDELEGSSTPDTGGDADMPRKVGDTGDGDRPPHITTSIRGIVKAVEHTFRDRGVTDIDPVQFHRRQYGGRPEALRRDLRRLWRGTYLEAKRTMTEPQAWDAAWSAVHEKAALEPKPSRTICVLPWSGNGWTPSKPTPLASAVSAKTSHGDTPSSHAATLVDNAHRMI